LFVKDGTALLKVHAFLLYYSLHAYLYVEHMNTLYKYVCLEEI